MSHTTRDTNKLKNNKTGLHLKGCSVLPARSPESSTPISYIASPSPSRNLHFSLTSKT